MRIRRRKSVPIILTGALVSSLAVIEGREEYHVEQRQYEQPLTVTYEISNSTATMSVVTLLNPSGWDGWQR